jgi:predicted  nucleic acid-binding Zn-ribbon protein
LESIDRLREVQRLAGKISLYNSEIDKHDNKLKMAEAAKEELVAEASPIESRLAQGMSIARKLELDVAEVDEKVIKTRKQLDQATQASEFTGLKQQLARFEQEKAAIEENLMLVLEKIEELRSQSKDLAERSDQARSQFEELRADVEKNTVEYRDEVQSLEGPLQLARDGTDAELLEVFDRLFPSIGATVVVSLEDHTCGGCHLNVSSQVVEKVHAGAVVVNCPSCSRILG